MGPRGSLGEVLEKFENEFEKRGPPKSCRWGWGPSEGDSAKTWRIQIRIRIGNSNCLPQWDQTCNIVPKGTVADIIQRCLFRHPAISLEAGTTRDKKKY